MKRNCLGCGENIILDKKIEYRIIDKAESEIQKLVKLGKSEKELRRFPFEYFIPDKELYCNSCSENIVAVESKARELLVYSVNRNRKLNFLLDQNYIFYSNKGFSSKSEKEKFVYLFSYIEECQSLCSEIVEELNLLFIRFNEHIVINHNNFTYMYYFRNLSMKTVSLVEKLTVFYATIFNVEFRKNKLQNKPELLLKKLRKKESFGDTIFCSMITSYRQSGDSFKVEKCRKFLDHDLSYSEATEMMKILGLINIISNLSKMSYGLIEEMIFLMKEVYKDIDIPIDYSVNVFFDQTRVKPITDIDFDMVKKYASIFGGWVNSHNMLALKRLSMHTEDQMRMFDIENRLHEVSRTHCIVFNIMIEAHEMETEVDRITIDDSTGKNYSSLINDMIYRIYSINDKLARLINIKFDLNPQDDYIYFEDISELIDNDKQFISNNFQLYKALKDILNCREYKYLTTNRNRMHHIRNDYHNYDDRQRLEYNVYRLSNIQSIYPYLEKIVVLLK